MREFDMKVDRKLRGRVIAEWETAEKPNWGKKETIGMCLLVDAELKADKLNPSPKFRKAVELNNLKYVRTWVLGCHFSWLNPR